MRKHLLLTGWLAGLFLLLVRPALGAAEEREVVILYTNDFHSAIDPIPAYWHDERPIPHLGGAAELMTLVEHIRKREAKVGNPVFLFDTGDMFTGMLSKLTKGEALMEMMHTMGYDALGIGNHEFDYGWENFRRQMFRVPFPCLGANIFFKTTRNYALNKSAGRLWIDAKTYEIAQLEFELLDKVKIWWGFIGSIRQMRGRLQRAPVDGYQDVWLPSRFDIYMNGWIFFKTLHRNEKMEWTDFRKLPEQAQQAAVTSNP